MNERMVSRNNKISRFDYQRSVIDMVLEEEEECPTNHI